MVDVLKQGPKPDGKKIGYNNQGQLTIIPEFAEGWDESDMLSLINDTNFALYKAGAAQEGYKNVLFDVFVDQSKISSSSNVNVQTLDSGDSKSEISLSFTEETLDRTNDNDSFTPSSGVRYGLKFNPNTSLNGIKGTISANTADFTYAQLLDSSGNVITEKEISGKTAGDTVEFADVNLSSGTDYILALTNKSSGWTVGRYGSADFPNGTEFDIVSSWGNGGDRTSYTVCFTDMTAYSGYQTEGTLQSVSKSTSSAPETIQFQQEADIPSNTDIQVEIYDSSDSLVTTIDQTEVGEDVSISTSDTSFYAKIIESGDGTATPTLYEYGVMF